MDIRAVRTWRRGRSGPEGGRDHRPSGPRRRADGVATSRRGTVTPLGEPIVVTAAFNEPVMVEGTPRMRLNIGGRPRLATLRQREIDRAPLRVPGRARRRGRRRNHVRRSASDAGRPHPRPRAQPGRPESAAEPRPFEIPRPWRPGGRHPARGCRAYRPCVAGPLARPARPGAPSKRSPGDPYRIQRVRRGRRRRDPGVGCRERDPANRPRQGGRKRPVLRLPSTGGRLRCERHRHPPGRLVAARRGRHSRRLPQRRNAGPRCSCPAGRSGPPRARRRQGLAPCHRVGQFPPTAFPDAAPVASAPGSRCCS